MVKYFGTELRLENVWKNVQNEVGEVWEKSLNLGSSQKRDICLEFYLEFAYLSQMSLGWPLVADHNEYLEKSLNWTKKDSINTQTFHVPVVIPDTLHCGETFCVLNN